MIPRRTNELLTLTIITDNKYFAKGKNVTC